MVKRFSFLIVSMILALLTLNACTPTYCSTPDILYKGICCPDKDQDGACDEEDLELEDTYPYEIPPKVMEEQKEETPTFIKTKEGVLLTVNPDDDPYLGNENAQTQFVAFGDYTDKSTQRFHKEILQQLIEEYGNYIKYTFRNYPDLTNSRSMQAAEASECAKEQEKFWEYHNVLLDNIHRLSTSYLLDYAEGIGLDVIQFENCLNTNRYAEEVAKDRNDGETYRVVVTPTFFINNQRVLGFKQFTTFQAILEDELYEELQATKGTVLSAKSIGKRSYQILEGPAALDPTVTVSPYTNKLDFVDATLIFTAQDKTKQDTPTTQDTAQLTATFTIIKPFTEDKYRIELQELISEGIDHTFFGGVGTNELVNGNTEIGTPYLPPSTAQVILWGKSNIYKNEELIATDSFTQFMITPSIRDANKKLLQRTPTTGTPEAYLLLSGKYGGSYIQGTEQGFIHLYWDTLDLRQ